GVRVWLEARARNAGIAATVRCLWSVAVAYAVVFAIGIAGILLVIRSAGTRSYGARNLGSIAGIAHFLFRDALRAPSLAIGFVPVILALLVMWRRGDLHRFDGFGALLFFAWVVPQYAIHGARGGFWDHYWLPCV